MSDEQDLRFEGCIIVLCLIVIAIILLIGLQPARAQEAITWFYGDCVEWMGGDHYHIRLSYTFGGRESYDVALIKPVASNVFTNVPNHITTEPNGGKDWWLDVQGQNIQATYTIAFFNPIRKHSVALNTWDYPLCEDSLQPLLPWAIDSSTGERYYYTPNADGSAPLPPAVGG